MNEERVQHWWFLADDGFWRTSEGEGFDGDEGESFLQELLVEILYEYSPYVVPYR